METSSNVSIIMYHYVRNLKKSRYPEIKGLDLSLFYEQIDYLTQNDYTFISAEQLLDALDKRVSLPENSVLLTFDDGYIDHYTSVFPILRNKGIPAFFSMPGKILAEHKLLDVNKIHFILASKSIPKLLEMLYQRLDYYRGQEYSIPDNKALYNKLAVGNRFDPAEVIFIKRALQVELEEGLRNRIVDDLFAECIPMTEDAFVQELYMSEEQIKLMQREGMCFGIHGYDHYWMNRLTPDELEKDITKAIQTFDGIVDAKRWICCYPYGSYSDAVASYIETQGAAAGFTTHVDQAYLDRYGRFSLPRFDTNDFPPKSNRFAEYISV